jgi:hypothetical protein
MSDEMQTTNQMILARIARLERQNRMLKRGALAVLVFVTVLFVVSLGLMGQATTSTAQKKPPAPKAAKPAPAPAPAPAPFVMPANIEAQSFILKDANGRVRAELYMDGEGPSLKLLDQNGASLVGLSLRDASPSGPFLLLSDPQHQSSVSISVAAGEGSQLSMIGERADIQAHIGVTPGGTTMELSDKDGFTTSIGSGMQPTKNGQVKKTSAASVTLFTKDRKVLWSAP